MLFPAHHNVQREPSPAPGVGVGDCWEGGVHGQKKGERLQQGGCVTSRSTAGQLKLERKTTELEIERVGNCVSSLRNKMKKDSTSSTNVIGVITKRSSQWVGEGDGEGGVFGSGTAKWGGWEGEAFSRVETGDWDIGEVNIRIIR